MASRKVGCHAVSEWVVGAAKTAGPVVTGMRWAVRRVGWSRRLLLSKDLKKLEPGNTVATFASILGQPLSSRRDSPWRRHRFETPDVEVEAVTEEDDVTVVAYHVKSRKAKYHPRLVPVPPALPPWEIKLGVTTFAQIGDWEPIKIDVAWGAVGWWYRELHYFGAPGRYRHFVFEIFDSEPGPEMIEFLRAYNVAAVDRGPEPAAEIWAGARAATFIERYGVYDAEADLSDWPNSGP